jgi:hypothetical protein
MKSSKALEHLHPKTLSLDSTAIAVRIAKIGIAEQFVEHALVDQLRRPASGLDWKPYNAYDGCYWLNREESRMCKVSQVVGWMLELCPMMSHVGHEPT